MESFVLADATNSHQTRSSTSIEPLDQVSSRTMKSGACTATTYWGKRVITCECTEGIFDVPLSKTEAGEIPCDSCGHSLSQHASATGQGLTTGATKVPLEAQFRDEIYRAVYLTLGQKIFLTSEWGASSKDGRVDFLLKKVKWGIECVREGTRLEEHVQRFLSGGRYYPWIEEKQMLDYILIDFRKSMPKISKGNKSSKCA